MRLRVQVPGEDAVDIVARNGWSVMDAMRDAGVPVRGECGGGKICATCHVHVAGGLTDATGHPDEDEMELLVEAESYDPASSRLSCQILCDDALDGLTVDLQPDAVAD